MESTPKLVGPHGCPGGGSCFHNHGTRPGVPKSFDCEVRKHAWEVAKATLPEHGDFQSAYDALQLAACGVPRPAAADGFTPPTFPTPTNAGRVLWVDAGGGGDGNGTAAAPYRTLEEAVAAAAKLPSGMKTIVLKAGTYYTAGVTLTQAGSDFLLRPIPSRLSSRTTADLPLCSDHPASPPRTQAASKRTRGK